MTKHSIFDPMSFFGGDRDDEWNLEPFTKSGLSVYDDKDHLVVEADLPGVDPEHIEVTLDNGFLYIKGEKKQKEEKNTYHMLSSQKFFYRLTLPIGIDPHKDPETHCKNGVMRLRFLKKSDHKPRRIQVKSA